MKTCVKIPVKLDEELRIIIIINSNNLDQLLQNFLTGSVYEL